ncbi:hypothetical protein LTR85_003519 [Meristemomyces frigidus]|nr:hypothetical protein LTR85_003519 [Meristemomyces frigidus]
MKAFGLLAFAAAVAVTVATPIVERAPTNAIVEHRPTHLPANPDGLPLDPCLEKRFNHGLWVAPGKTPYYEVICDSTINAALTAQAGSITNEKCMELCNDMDGCQGVVITTENACSLSTGGAGNLVAAKGTSAWVATTIGERSIASPERNGIGSGNPPLDPCADSAKNNFLNWTAPGGRTYQLRCNTILDVATYISGPDDNARCMLACDSTDDCLGVFQPTGSGDCFFAIGQYVGLSTKLGSAAWIPTYLLPSTDPGSKRGLNDTHIDMSVCTNNIYNGHTIPTPGGGELMKIVCNSGVLASSLVQFHAKKMSVNECLVGCKMNNDLSGNCVGVYLDKDGNCIMGLGTYNGLTPMQDSIALIPAAGARKDRRSQIEGIPPSSPDTKRELNDRNTALSVCLHGQTVSNPYGGEWMQVVCNYGVLATNLITYEKEGMTFEDCLINCQINYCVGVYLYKSNYCIVGTGTYNGLTRVDDATALIPASIPLRERSASIEGKVVEPTMEERDSSYCPSMNEQQITDASGSTYEISCDITLADLQVLGYGMTADRCTTACDNQADCIFATLQPNGECGSLTNPLGPVVPSPMTGAMTFKRIYKTDPRSSTGVETIEKRQLPIDRYDWACTYAGDEAPISNLNTALESFCSQYDGYPVEAGGAWLGNTWTVNGYQIWCAVHNAPGGKSFPITYNECIWGFQAVRDSCSPDGQLSHGSQGGYAWFYAQFTTYLIGINGNAPDPCNGSC